MTRAGFDFISSPSATPSGCARFVRERVKPVVGIAETGTPSGARDRRTGSTAVSLYWVVDPDLDVVRVYRNRDGRFERPVELRADAGDVLTSAHLGGLEMPLGRIFAE